MVVNTNPTLMLIGVGGGGCAAVATAARLYGEGLDALGLDTDTAAIRNVLGVRCVLLGRARLDGQGAAGCISMGTLAAQDDLPGVANAFEGVRTAVVVATLGGGTGGGATPVLLRQLANMGVTTLCFALTPWKFEDPARADAARQALALIEPVAGTLVTLAPEDLLPDAGLDETAGMGDVIERCGRALSERLSLLWRVLNAPEHIRFDAARLRALLLEGGAACALLGQASGENRAARAVASLVTDRVRDRLSGVQTALLAILGGRDLRLIEINDIVRDVRPALYNPCRLEIATVVHEAYANRVALLMLAFDPVARVAPAPPPADLEELDTLALPAGKPARGKKNRNPLRDSGGGRFQGVEKTFINGQNFDIPTYSRKNILIEK